MTQSNVSVGTSGPPGSYPSIFRGCHWGSCTSNSGLPIQVSSLGHPTSSWATTQPGTGAYNVAYDLWFNQSSSTSGQPNGAELMIWINRSGGVQPFGSKVATTNFAGRTWEIWQGPMAGWNYIAYVLQGGATSLSDLDLGDITRDAVARGAINPSWHLVTVEAGFEIWQGGAGLATNSFSFTPTGAAAPSTTITSTPSTTAPPTTTTPTTSPPSGGGACSVSYRVTAQWVNGSTPNGFTADVIIRNTGGATINGWRVAWSWPAPGQRVQSAWNANVTQNGGAVSATNLSYNSTIPPGGSQSFGFVGAWTGSNPPPSFSCST